MQYLVSVGLESLPQLLTGEIFREALVSVNTAVQGSVKIALGLGLMLFIFFNVVKSYMSGKGGDWQIDKLFPYLVIIMIFNNSNFVINMVDDIFKKPAETAVFNMQSAIEKNISKIADNKWSEQITKAEENAKIAKQKRQKDYDVIDKMADEVSSIGNLPSNLGKILMISILTFINLVLLAGFIITVLLMVISGAFGAEIMIALFPLSFAMQLLPFYSGSLASWFKNYIAFRLWSLVGATIAIHLINNMVFNDIFEQLNVSMEIIGSLIAGEEAPELKINIITPISLLIFIGCMSVIPSAIDKAINASSSGAAGGMLGAGTVGSKLGGLAGGSLIASKLYKGSSNFNSGVSNISQKAKAFDSNDLKNSSKPPETGKTPPKTPPTT